MYVSSYIRYLKMSKFCKIDINSYLVVGFFCFLDGRKEKLNMVIKFFGAFLIVFRFV